MALNQKLEEILTTNSQFQLKINELEIQLNSVTSFLKQQFGDDFQLNNAYNSDSSANGYPLIDSPPKVQLVEISPKSTTQNSQQHLTAETQVLNCSHPNEISNNQIIEITNSTSVSKTSTDSTATTSTPKEHQQCVVIIEKLELHNNPINKANDMENLTEEKDDAIATVKIELNPLELEQMSPGSTTDSELNDILADYPTAAAAQTDGESIERQRHCSNLQRKIHTIDKPYVCDWPKCSQRFKYTGHLISHKRTHTGEKPYICDWQDCKRAFALVSTLNSHRRIHTGEKPYICNWDNCGRPFGDRSTLAKHKRIHTGERPFICDEVGCGKQFTRRSSLLAHQQRSHQS